MGRCLSLCPNSHEAWCAGVDGEIVVPERIVYTLAIADEKGDVLKSLVKPTGAQPSWSAMLDCLTEKPAKA